MELLRFLLYTILRCISYTAPFAILGLLIWRRPDICRRPSGMLGIFVGLLAAALAMWNEDPLELFCYFVFFGGAYLVILLVVAWVVALYSWKQEGLFSKKIGRVGLFFTLLLTVSAIADGLWCWLVLDRMYLEYDAFCEFVPFFPVTQGRVEEQWGNMHGHLLGDATYWELYLVWVGFAAVTWTVTIVLYRLLKDRVSLRLRLRRAVESH